MSSYWQTICDVELTLCKSTSRGSDETINAWSCLQESLPLICDLSRLGRRDLGVILFGGISTSPCEDSPVQVIR